MPSKEHPVTSSYGVLSLLSPRAPLRAPRLVTLEWKDTHGAASVQKHAGGPPCTSAARVISRTSRLARSATAFSLEMPG
eukprot:15430604-Alexandrium_andersonii.AAC.1